MEILNRIYAGDSYHRKCPYKDPIIQDDGIFFEQSILYLNSYKNYITIHTIFPKYLLYLKCYHYFNWMYISKYLIYLAVDGLYVLKICKKLVYLFYNYSENIIKVPDTILYLNATHLKRFERDNFKNLLSQYLLYISCCSETNQKIFSNYTLFSKTNIWY